MGFPVNEARASAETAAFKYAVETRLSRFTVQAFAGGLLSAIGHSPVLTIHDFTGEILFESEAVERSSMHLKIRADSLTVTSDSSDKDRREIERTMNQEVLETARYPEITFDTRRVSGSHLGEGAYMVSLSGDLTLHGVSHNIVIPARANVTGDMLRASGEFSIRQTEYGIKLASVAGGVLKVKDELKFKFDIVARKQE
jgi:polyisoprenoid-binding protein YceI